MDLFHGLFQRGSFFGSGGEHASLSGGVVEEGFCREWYGSCCR